MPFHPPPHIAIVAYIAHHAEQHDEDGFESMRNEGKRLRNRALYAIHTR